MVYVIDSNDEERVPIAIEELENILKSEELQNAAILVFLNKSDMKKMDDQLIKHIFDPLLVNRVFKFQKTSMVTGDGLTEGLKWLSKNIPKLK